MMKYQLTRNDIEPSYPGQPFGWVPDDMRELVETREVFESGRKQQKTYWRSDVVFDNVWGPTLVRRGMANPMDDECAETAGLTPLQIESARLAYDRTNRGIHPDDFDAFDRGYMTGYQPDGSWIPGPAYQEWESQQVEEEDDDLE